MKNRWRQHWFNHYWWVIILFLVALASLVICVFGLEAAPGPIATVTAAGVALAYITQKQKLEEIKLFGKLFSAFNKRYQELSEKLQVATSDPPNLHNNFRDAFGAYFNLCAEEYLFYSQGRILPEVWAAWCNGMKQYWEHEKVRKYWDVEVKSGSYYGFDFYDIQECASVTQKSAGGRSELHSRKVARWLRLG